jgi:hypothetical protein
LASFGGKIDHVYRKLGEKWLLFVLFAGTGSLHVIFALRMSAPSIYPDEFRVAAWSAFFSGFNYAGDFPGSTNIAAGGSPGWLHAALYTPFYYLFNNPVIRYRGMLIMNGVFASFIPLLTYRITASLGLEKAWQRTLIALLSGVGTAAFAYTKFIWSEALCVFLAFLTFWLFIKTAQTKNRVLRLLLSFFTAFVLALAPAAHPRMWALVLAFILTVIYANYILRVKTVMMAGFLPVLAVFLAFQVYVSEELNAISGGQVLLSPLGGLGTAGSGNITLALLGQLYYFAVSAWGVGILGICLCFSFFFTLFANRKTPLVKSQALFAAFAFFTLFYNVLTLIVSAFRGGGLLADGTGGQEAYIFGRYIDGTMPFVLIFTLCYVFITGLDFKKLLHAIIALGAVFTLFLGFAAPALVRAGMSGSPLNAESIQGFSPIRIGTMIDAPITTEGIYFTVSATFCFIALLVVLVNCAERYRAHMISFCATLIIIYSCLHSMLVYLPHEARSAEAENAGAHAISEYVYNSADAPPTYVLNGEPSMAPILRFLNRNAAIKTAQSLGELSEDCFIVAEAGTINNTENIVILAEAGGFVFAAKGERAAAFALSQM